MLLVGRFTDRPVPHFVLRGAAQFSNDSLRRRGSIPERPQALLRRPRPFLLTDNPFAQKVMRGQIDATVTPHAYLNDAPTKDGEQIPISNTCRSPHAATKRANPKDASVERTSFPLISPERGMRWVSTQVPLTRGVRLFRGELQLSPSLVMY